MKLFEVVERDVWYHNMKLDIEKENLKPQLFASNSRPSNPHVKPPSSILNRSKASI